ncbi:MAG: HPr family phosphocarrier protein [Candidatus Omnitrophica bacterium]|nr:HPr family phosphocarrier protein [Candidatus Omnitrophota bacterium]MCM8797953.1 HPr family phosphocarrier protein [Candidatus Omnitrophota bacterium]
MKKIKKKIVVKNKQGLHARPAALFVQIANKFDANITVRKGSLSANGKSIMGILMLEIGPGSEILIEAEGEDAERAIIALERIILEEEPQLIK